MTQIAAAHAVSTAAPADFFAVWADMATWPEWNADTEWVRLDGPFVEGATGTLKPKGGPKVGFVDVLRGVFGARLMFPVEFVGRGDMSRGGLLLRKAREGVELDYVAVSGAVRHGPRPPRLARQPRHR